ncbi:hypothetical protein COY25_03910 [Candidatus Uhrbacteria bacterium CG_4_10_14_0_2_um_filter_41_7]|uniref:Serine hydrolase family protein n=1 Tax=Candidatus Uhrbacteria bacterium CG_4_9_14_3_um_filter_41_35 TaxID=1975034 RepID=A0A2M7XGY7_9BACT|nr:MAG: hypothetical protein COV92_02645 [Candidatus Uhrbacteria bacterium CG11_big_fil_rev_8_21_14_0_20_41_9]PIZ53175.1 MAG: hypothetical protein COY25_03910 [Candidatus Uhrbacteria bacterium CG_4_10_14_0_2_um_filter_41_7]PJA47131.1 MAG: hypothetical protein CO173_00110 [Candidatus Uhrbacteria bacterium CG_4_9_14_3_um_filter_41_35]
MKIVLVHGYKSSPDQDFFPWLRAELVKLGHQVVLPNYINASTPDRDEWTKFLVDEVGALDENTIIVSHSIGAVLALRLLEAAEAYSTPKGMVLISAPWMIGSEEFRHFFLSELDFDVLAWRAKFFKILHAKDDKVIPFDHAKKYAQVLHGELIEGSVGAGHYKGDKYPEILDLVKRVIDTPVVYEPGQGLEDEYKTVDR